MIAWAIRHQADIATIQADVAKIMADFPAAAHAMLKAESPEALKASFMREAALSGQPLSFLVSGLRALETLLPLIPALQPYAATIKSVIDLLIGEIGG